MSRSQNPHLVYLAFFYPPSRASGVYRAIATANVFRKAGWDVTVVSVEERFFIDEIGTYDKSLFEDLEPSIDIIRVPFSFAVSGAQKKVQKFGWLKSNFPRVYRKLRRLIKTLLLDRKRLLLGTDKYSDWIEPAVQKVIQIHEDKPASHLLATANPFVAFQVALQVREKINLDFSIDYRDPWTTDVYSGKRANHPKRIFQLEQRIVQKATHVFHVNQAMAEVCRKQYPESAEKHKVAPNGFDNKSVAAASSRNSGNRLVFAMLGTLNPHWPFNEIVQAWVQARQHLPPNSLLRLGGYLGYFAQSDLPLRELLPQENRWFEYVGPVLKSEVSDFYRSASVIIIPASGGPLVTTGKVYEVAAQPNPIVCVQAENGGARKALEGRPLVHSCVPLIDSIERAIRDAASSFLSMRDEDIQKIKEFAVPFERETSLKVMVDSIGGKELSRHG